MFAAAASRVLAQATPMLGSSLLPAATPALAVAAAKLAPALSSAALFGSSTVSAARRGAPHMVPARRRRPCLAPLRLPLIRSCGRVWAGLQTPFRRRCHCWLCAAAPRLVGRAARASASCRHLSPPPPPPSLPAQAVSKAAEAALAEQPAPKVQMHPGMARDDFCDTQVGQPLGGKFEDSYM